MIKTDDKYVVMGLLNSKSIAWAIGEAIRKNGGRVVYTVQNEVLKRRYFDSDKAIDEATRAGLEVRYCDAGDSEQIKAVFAGLGPLAGVVHSLAYANPGTCLGDEFHTDAMEDILKSYRVSAVSLAEVARYAVREMPGGGSIVALSFDTRHAYPRYNWMGVNKAALEALVRALARRHGRDRVRVNAVSAGPLATMAGSKIPGFEHILETCVGLAPLGWDPYTDHGAVADAVCYLLGAGSAKITGHTLPVDGGFSVMGGSLLDFERGV